MQLHELNEKAEPKEEPDRRLGRGDGSGKGTYCGRGVKGQKARSGFSQNPFFSGGNIPIIQRMPKWGFSNKDFKETYEIVNVEDLNRFDDGEEITPEKLIDDGVARPSADQDIKILGGGELNTSLTVYADAFSSSAREKIDEAGGEALATDE